MVTKITYLLQCKQMITGGHLPVTLDQAIFMSGLQLHVEVSVIIQCNDVNTSIT